MSEKMEKKQKSQWGMRLVFLCISSLLSEEEVFWDMSLICWLYYEWSAGCAGYQALCWALPHWSLIQCCWEEPA